MLKNPIQVRIEKFEPWQHITFMTSLCERMYPNFAMFCENTQFAEARIYRDILDSVWELLTVKTAKINFEKQLEKLEEIIPSSEDFDFYGVYPAIDACVALSTLLHGLLDRDYLLESSLKISQQSVMTVAQLVEMQQEIEITNDNQKDNEVVCEEWDVQWSIYRPLRECTERDVELIKELRLELKEQGVSNIGIAL
ncbi:YjaG family protein [Vibrio nomapromontoriensis]|uniref:YjaG family protein n=1 Tax=Vibrio nomapromontoriensis TaxID=2910246 RepID=UPI003D0DF80A